MSSNLEEKVENPQNIENTAIKTAGEETKEESKKTFGTPFKSGDEWKGNKNGRPKGSRNLTKVFEEAMEEVKERAKAKGVTIEDPEIEIMLALLSQAQKGNVRAMELYMKYKYGNPTQPVDLSGEVKLKTENIVDIVDFYKHLLSEDELVKE